MINEKAQEHILSAIAKEKEAAISNHGYFHSDHEFWAVLKEEVEELQDATSKINLISVFLSQIWDAIKEDKSPNNIDLSAIKLSAKNIAFEAIQVAAVIDKYLEGEKVQKREDAEWLKNKS